MIGYQRRTGRVSRPRGPEGDYGGGSKARRLLGAESGGLSQLERAPGGELVRPTAKAWGKRLLIAVGVEASRMRRLIDWITRGGCNKGRGWDRRGCSLPLLASFAKRERLGDLTKEEWLSIGWSHKGGLLGVAEAIG